MSTVARTYLLLEKYRNGLMTSSEWQELVVLLNTLDESERENLLSSHEPLWHQAVNGQSTQPAGKPALRIHFLRWSFLKYAAAILLILGAAGVYLYYQKEPASRPATATTTIPSERVMPGTNRAILTLADGSRIALDSAANGKLAVQGGMDVLKSGGSLSYRTGARDLVPESENTSLAINTMITPRGGQYQLTLADGTKVWLNAASSITFPTAFTGKQRNVAITGEAYFEVTKNQKPFVVEVNNTKIEVLGTHFNINAYSDESAITATLLEGRIRVTNNNKSEQLVPGEQAIVSGDISINQHANTAQAVAWKNGFFQFDKNDVPSILRQVGRWYDLDIVYKGKVTDDLFSGKIQRSLPLKSILRLLEQGNLRFRVEEKRLIML